MSKKRIPYLTENRIKIIDFCKILRINYDNRNSNF